MRGTRAEANRGEQLNGWCTCLADVDRGVPGNAGSCMAMVKARTAISMRLNDHAEHCVTLRFILAMDAQCNHAGIFASHDCTELAGTIT